MDDCSAELVLMLDRHLARSCALKRVEKYVTIHVAHWTEAPSKQLIDFRQRLIP